MINSMLTNQRSPITVNGVEISENAIGHELQYHPAETETEAYNAAVNALIVREVLLQQAVRLGFDGVDFIGENPSADERVEENTRNNETETEEEAMVRLLVEREVKTPTASDADCRQYYLANRQQFQTTPLVEVSHILIAAHPRDDKQRAEVKTLAEELIKQLQTKPENFARYVKDYSECPSKETKGSLGQLSKGQTVPEFERIIFSLPEGLAPYPIESRYGFHIARIDRRVAGKLLNYSMVEQRIRHYLNEKVQRKAISQYIHILMGQADIQGVKLDVQPSFLVQ